MARELHTPQELREHKRKRKAGELDKPEPPKATSVEDEAEEELIEIIPSRKKADK